MKWGAACLSHWYLPRIFALQSCQFDYWNYWNKKGHITPMLVHRGSILFSRSCHRRTGGFPWSRTHLSSGLGYFFFWPRRYGFHVLEPRFRR
ncbi:hypothetical protein F4810DRAFT_685902 [Camillea tinctor]|nr:hypothetical protein F4810DRAFT_685902 [Camillea tinctor]